MKTKFKNQLFQINKKDFVNGYQINNLKSQKVLFRDGNISNICLTFFLLIILI
jgi:hypothetical protein